MNILRELYNKIVKGNFLFSFFSTSNEIKKEEIILIFPKGTVVKFDGIPCELLHDTAYESNFFRQRMMINDPLPE
jgi:hypothetical protein